MQNFSDVSLSKKTQVKSYIEALAKEYNSRIISEKVKEKFQIIISDRTVRSILQSIRESIDGIGETLEKAIEAVNEKEEKEYEIFEKD